MRGDRNSGKKNPPEPVLTDAVALALFTFATNRIFKLLGEIMASQNEFKDALDKVFAEIGETAQLVRDLKDQLANGGLTPEEEADVLSQLAKAADALDAIQNPPAPEPPPVE